MARRVTSNIAVSTKRIEIGDEWLDHREVIPYGQFSKMQSEVSSAKDDSDEANHRMLALFITDWSFKDERGETLPINYENVRDNQDAPILTELFLVVIGSDFLDRMSRLRKANS